MSITLNLPDHARVWVYQASRVFTAQESKQIKERIDVFLADWNTHGTALSADIQLFYNMFLIVGVDEAVAKASGCSIDQSVRLIKELEATFNVSLTGRTSLAYWENDEIKTMHFADFKQKIATGELPDNTLMFNNLIGTVGELRDAWQTEARNSWLTKVPA